MSTRARWEALRAHKLPEFNFEFQVGKEQKLLPQDGWWQDHLCPPRASENTPTPHVWWAALSFFQHNFCNLHTEMFVRQLWLSDTEHMMVLHTHFYYSQRCPAHWTPTEALRRRSGRRGEAAGYLNWALLGQRAQLHSFNIWDLSQSEFMLYPVIRFGLATSSAPSLFGRMAPFEALSGVKWRTVVTAPLSDNPPAELCVAEEAARPLGAPLRFRQTDSDRQQLLLSWKIWLLTKSGSLQL